MRITKHNPYFWTRSELTDFLGSRGIQTAGPIRKLRKRAHQLLKTEKLLHNKRQQEMPGSEGTHGFPLFGKSKSKEDVHEQKTTGTTPKTHGFPLFRKSRSKEDLIDRKSIDSLDGERGATGGTPQKTYEQMERELAEIREKMAHMEQICLREQRHQPAPPPQPHTNITILSQLQPFDGNRGTDVTQFFDKIDRLASLGNWTEQDNVNVIGLKLEGQARTFWETLRRTNPNITYGVAKTKIIERFSQETTTSDLLQQLTTLKLQPGETIDSLSDRISAVHTKILHTNGQDQLQTLLKLLEQMTIESFINALPSKIAKHVRVLFPKTLEEATRLAQTIHAMDLSCGPTSIFAVQKGASSDTDSEDDSRLEDTLGLSDRKRRQKKSTDRTTKKDLADKQRSKQPPSPCKYCKGEHWHSECTERKTRSSPSSRSSSRSNSPNSRSNSRSSSPNGSPSFKRKSRCYNCDGLGHFSRECTVRKNKQKHGQTYGAKCQICKNTGHTALRCNLFTKLTGKN